MSDLLRGVADKPFLYLAAPLFSVGEKRFNEEISSLLGRYFTVYLPQRDGGLFVDLIDRGHSKQEAIDQVFSIDIKALDQAHVVLAILDGRAIDEGVALEIGYAYALKKPCFGLQTDPRRLLPAGNNPMISGVLSKVVSRVDDLHDLSREILESLRQGVATNATPR